MPAGGQARRMPESARQRRRPPAGRARVAVRTAIAGMRESRAARWWRRLGRRARALVASGAALAAVAVIVLAVVVASGPRPRARARQYLAFTACLLTDGRGVAASPAAQVWAGMQAASLATRAKVEYLPVTTGSTEGAAAPVLASLVAQGCKVVVAAGPPQVAAVEAGARSYPAVRFAVVGGSGPTVLSRPNVTVVAGSASAVRQAVAGLVSSAVAAAG